MPRLPILLVALAANLSEPSCLRAQHDGHREAMIDLSKGRSDRALERLERLLEEPESLWRGSSGAYARVARTVGLQGADYRRLVEPETHYTLALLHSLEGDGEASLRHARAAVAGGLSFGRFLAGPRSAFEALYATEGFREWAAGEPRGLLHGPMLGQVTAEAASFWVRTADESEVTLRVLDAAGAERASAAGRSRGEDDYTAVLRVEGLAPDTRYRYELLVDGEPAEFGFLLEQEAADGPAFRTAPPGGQGAAFRVAFTACAGYAPEHERVWDTIREQDPLALLMLGDNVYIDDPESELTDRFCYYRRFSRPEWRRLVSGRGVYAIWDDHDFGDDDSFGGPAPDDPPWKRDRWNVFRQNWNNPAYGGGEDRPGVWFDFHLGDVHFILLDGRYYREPNGRSDRHPPQSDAPSMLGPEQLAWLKETLRTSKATFKVIASPVPWADGSVEGRQRFDKWEGFPAERSEIFGHLAEHEIGGVILISGDRHRSDARRIDREGAYPLYDFMSAIPTNYHTHPVVEGPGHLFGYNEDNCFALLHFDTAAADPTVAFEIVGIDGDSIWRHELRLSELSH
jgi:alkaline phosphatase D